MKLIAVGLVALALTTAGCRQVAAPWLLWGEEPTKDVPAEYAFLAGKKVCILVWAEMDTLFEYPHVQLEVSEHVRVELEGHVKGIKFVPNAQVVDMQRRDPDWDRKDPMALGSRMSADTVMLIELTHYATREQDSPHLYRGRISANVKVYEVHDRRDSAAYKRVIETVYPPDMPGQWGTDEQAVRLATLRAFAADVSRKFYDRKEKTR